MSRSFHRRCRLPPARAGPRRARTPSRPALRPRPDTELPRKEGSSSRTGGKAARPSGARRPQPPGGRGGEGRGRTPLPAGPERPPWRRAPEPGRGGSSCLRGSSPGSAKGGPVPRSWPATAPRCAAWRPRRPRRSARRPPGAPPGTAPLRPAVLRRRSSSRARRGRGPLPPLPSAPPLHSPWARGLTSCFASGQGEPTCPFLRFLGSCGGGNAS